ncbi:MAG: hypothetical protein ABI647_11450 [Gemmatimonadota bacterium]
MPSRADVAVWTERGLRLLAYGALAAALLQSLTARSPRPRTITVSSSALPALLAGAARSGDTLVVVTDSALGPVYRDWLAAARAAGRVVGWSGTSIPAIAVAVEPLADPAGGDRVLVAAPNGATVALADSAGAIDSAAAGAGGASFAAPALAGSASATVGRQTARAVRTDSLLLRHVVVFGRASWETKFVIAALEERGWAVDARIALRPEAAVVQGSTARLDTARVAAVVALDEAAVPEGAAIAAFVRQGGGLVLGPAAAASATFAPLRAGAPGERQSAPVFEVGAAEPRRALALVPIVHLAVGALPLERRGSVVAIAAQRVGAGRVLQLGYEDTWRWRMSGPEGAVLAHRAWWTSLVGSVAYRASVPLAPRAPANDAPRARMVAALGPPDPSVPSPARDSYGDRPARPWWWLFAVAAGALVAEWARRRRRGTA